MEIVLFLQQCCEWCGVPRYIGGNPHDDFEKNGTLITYLLTPWSRVLFEKLTGSAANQEIPHIFGTRRFLTVPISARHLSLSWANSMESPKLPPTSWRSILILSSHLRLGLPNGWTYEYTYNNRGMKISKCCCRMWHTVIYHFCIIFKLCRQRLFFTVTYLYR